MNRKRVILAALLGVLGICLIYAYIATPRLEKAPPREPNQRARVNDKATEDSKAKTTQDRINFDFMTVDIEEFPGAQRDIFRYGGRRPVRQAPQEKLPLPVDVPVVQQEAPETISVEVLNQALAQFTFLGFLEKAGEKTVFLSSGGNLFLVKRGERFGANQEMLVDDIDDKLLKVRHDGRNGLVEIPLIEQQKLSASVSSPAQIAPAASMSNHTKPRVFTPKQRVVRPAAPHETEESFPETFEEDNPEEEQESEVPDNGDVIEGEINGSNQ